MSSKLGKEASKRLATLLHGVTSTEVAPKISAVKKFLYTHDSSSEGLPSSMLDGLMQNQWKQRPINEAVSEITVNHVKSNVLYFKCKNQYITEQDFANLYPVHRERKYAIANELDFKVVKARNPVTLQFEGGYYFVFNNYTEACVYLSETATKSINGVGMNLRFVPVDRNKLKTMTSPFLGSDGRNLTTNIQKQDKEVNLQNPLNFSNKLYSHVPIDELFKYSPVKLELIQKLLSVEGTEVPYSLLCKLIDSTRHTSVLVRNLPLGLSQHTLPRLLWDYELASSPFTTIINDPVRQVHSQLVRFQHESSAERFVRNFHGKQWESMQHQRDEKKLYERLICEIVD